MIGVAVLAALALPVLAGPKLAFGVYGRAELRLREPGDLIPPQTEPSQLSADGILTAGVGMQAKLKRWTLEAGYSPRFTLRNFTVTPAYDLVHTGALSVEHRWPRVSLKLAETATYGDLAYYALAPGAVGAPPGIIGMNQPQADPAAGPKLQQAVPRAATIHFASSETMLSTVALVGTRSTITVGVGYALAGGIDDESRVLLPTARGPHAWFTWAYDLKHHNHLTTDVRGYLTETEPALAPPIHTNAVTAEEVWTREWGRRTTSAVGVGAGVVRTTGQIQAIAGTPPNDDFNPFPRAFATFSHGIKTGPKAAVLTLTANGGEDAVVDRLTGDADLRWTAGVGARWDLKLTNFYTFASRTQSIDQSKANAVRLTSAGAGFHQGLGKLFGIEVGATMFKQDVDNPTTAAALLAYNGVQWMEFVALTVTPKVF